MLLHRAALPILLLGGTLAGAQNVVHQTVHSDRVTPIHTALDHISVIALPEKITRVAAGSQAMQIEWHGNDVFVKPLQSGQSTDLMVWTEHQFSTYELEAPGDVKQMTFVLDETKSPVPQATRSVPPVATRLSKRRIRSPSPRSARLCSRSLRSLRAAFTLQRTESASRLRMSSATAVPSTCASR